MQNQPVLVLTTIDSRESALALAEILVERKLAACVNVLPGIVSVYRWKGAVERAEELQLVIKTTADRFSQVQAALKELHPYELPECLMVPVAGGSPEYLGWLAESLT
jgi:periplasmic divalent cation tolerance protein